MYNSETIISLLMSNDFSQVNNALRIIKEHYVRNVNKMYELDKYCVLEKLVSFLGHPKFCNISLSIIADACLLQFCALKIIKYDGYKCILRVMNSLVNDSIRHRACRAIGNMAKFGLDINPIQLEELISKVLLFLVETPAIPIKLTAVRTLRILSKYRKCREIIIYENANIHFAKLLSSSNKDLQLSCAQILAELTENCSKQCASKLIEYYENLVKVCHQCDADIKIHIVKCLKNLSAQEVARSDLVKVGAVKLFTDFVVDRESYKIAKHAIFGLCNCLDYMHMFDNYGTSSRDSLKILVQILSCDNFKDIHPYIIIALETISLKDGIVSLLLDIDVPIILIEFLKSFTKQHTFIHENSHYELKTRLSQPSRKFQKTDHYRNPLVNDLEDISIYNGKLYSSNDFFNTGSYYRENFPLADYSYAHSSGVSTYHSPSTSSDCISLSPPYNYHIWPPVFTFSKVPFCWSPLSHSTNGSCDEIRNISSFSGTTSLNNETVESVGDVLSNSASNSSCNNAENRSSITHNIDSKSKNEMVISDSDNILSGKHLATNKQAVMQFNIDDERLEKKCKNKKNVMCSNIKSKDAISVKEEVIRDNIDHRILSVLIRLSSGFKNMSYTRLADTSCFSVLIQYITSVPNANGMAKVLLLSLIKNPLCFEKLIKNGFVVELEKSFKVIHDLKSCNHCADLSDIYKKLMFTMCVEADTDYIVGTLCHILCTSSKICQLYTIGAISNLFHSRSSLYKTLIQANGLSFLFQWLKDFSERSVWEQAVIYLCKIYQNLKEMQDKNLDTCCISQTCKFEMATRCTYRDDVFNVSFIVDDGSKIQASREKVCKNSPYFQALLEGHFKETNESVVEIHDISSELLTTIFHFLHDCCSNSECCPYIKRIPFEVLLELLTECDKLLLFDAKLHVEDRLCHSLFHTTAYKVYKKAKLFNSPTLYNRALEYALCLDTSQKDSLIECFDRFLKLDGDFDVFTDLKKLITNMFVYKC